MHHNIINILLILNIIIIDAWHWQFGVGFILQVKKLTLFIIVFDIPGTERALCSDVSTSLLLVTILLENIIIIV